VNDFRPATTAEPLCLPPARRALSHAFKAVAWVLGGVFAVGAFAHDPGISTAQAEVRVDALAITTGFAPADAQQLLPADQRTEERWSQAEFDAAHETLLQLAPKLWEVRSGDTVLTPRDVRVELLAGDNVSFFVLFPRPGAGDKLILRAPKLRELPSGHRQFVIVSDERGSMITKKLLKAEDFTLAVPLSSGTGEAGKGPAATMPAGENTAWEFIKLGVEHIWTGYDHLLFLFALLVVCRSFRSIMAIVSCFTVAHSLTLALATLNVVNLPSRLVEAAIAASIVFVGAENLWRRGEEPRGRWALTFAFGLIHGFGFASVLRDLGVGAGAQGIIMPLFTFNLGVELGQVALAALVLPIVWRLRKNEHFIRFGVPAVSAVVALAGTYWLLERTIL
jgi:hydrogenase/urease accessory protein HupE